MEINILWIAGKFDSKLLKKEEHWSRKNRIKNFHRRNFDTIILTSSASNVYRQINPRNQMEFLLDAGNLTYLLYLERMLCKISYSKFSNFFSMNIITMQEREFV